MTRLGVSGHQTLPAEAAMFAKDHLRQRVADLHHRGEVLGITSLAAGADQLFADVVVEVGASLYVIVPSAEYEETFSDPATLRHYKVLLDKAQTVERLDFPRPDQEAFFAAGRRVVDLCDELIAVWDGLPARGQGGTADIVNYAKSVNRRVIVFWPVGVTR